MRHWSRGISLGVLVGAFVLGAPSSALAAGPCHLGNGNEETHGIGETVNYSMSGSFNSYTGNLAWGDGASVSTNGGSGSWSHAYADEGDFTVTVTGSGSYGSPATSCADNNSFPVHVRVWARLGMLTAKQTRPAFGTSQVHVPIYLSPHSASHDVTVNFETRDGTAKRNKDYVPVKGSVRFSPGTVSHEILVQIKASPTPDVEKAFNVYLTGATNAKLDPPYVYTRVTLEATQGNGTIFFRAKPTGILCGMFHIAERNAFVRCDYAHKRAAVLKWKKKATLGRPRVSLHPKHVYPLEKGKSIKPGFFTCKSYARVVSCKAGGHGFVAGKRKQRAF
jgi:hypothetical protein